MSWKPTEQMIGSQTLNKQCIEKTPNKWKNCFNLVNRFYEHEKFLRNKL